MLEMSYFHYTHALRQSSSGTKHVSTTKEQRRLHESTRLTTSNRVLSSVMTKYGFVRVGLK